MFGFELPLDIHSRWRADGKGQTIGQAELYPVWIAKRHWKQKLEHRNAIFFLDNESAKHALVRSYSPASASMDILWQVATVDAEARGGSWYSRVPSPSNPADGPSRLCFLEAQQRWGAVRVHPEILSP